MALPPTPRPPGDRGLSPRLGDSEPVPREDDVERCDFGAGEIAMLRAELRIARRVNTALDEAVAKADALMTEASGVIEKLEVDRKVLSKAVLSLADTAGMPDSYWQTDSRLMIAKEILEVPEDGRYTHAHLWTPKEESQ